jgi:4-hydroxy-3-polyprenylbenzoate decarboxylase
LKTERRRIVVGITGASGAVLGIRLLAALKGLGVETHLVVSPAGAVTLALETGRKLKEVHALASKWYAPQDIAAPIASGSFPCLGMIVAPCSTRTLAEIATGVTQGLLTRAADVTLKERRRLVLMLRETPLHTQHLRNMLALSEMGAVIAPPMPAFYNDPRTVEDIVDHAVGRALDLFGLDTGRVKRWTGPKKKRGG